jgi:hypothetical protein
MATPNKTQATAKGNGEAKERAPRKEWSDSEKRDNFRKAASARTSRVIKAIRSLKSVLRPSRYAWNEADAGKVLAAIANELRAVEAQFRNPATVKGADVFTL